jgi:GT2 family glycosyltransferase
LDADDYWVANKIEKQSILFKDCRHIIVGTNSTYINSFGEVIGHNLRTSSDTEANKILFQGKGMPSLLSTWLMPSDIFTTLGGFNETLPMSEDFDFAVKAVHIGFEFKILRENLAFYLLHDNSKTARRKLLQNRVAKAIALHYQNSQEFTIEHYLKQEPTLSDKRRAFVDLQIRKFLISARKNLIKRNYFRLLLVFLVDPHRLFSKFFRQKL